MDLLEGLFLFLGDLGGFCLVLLANTNANMMFGPLEAARRESRDEGISRIDFGS